MAFRELIQCGSYPTFSPVLPDADPEPVDRPGLVSLDRRGGEAQDLASLEREP